MRSVLRARKEIEELGLAVIDVNVHLESEARTRANALDLSPIEEYAATGSGLEFPYDYTDGLAGFSIGIRTGDTRASVSFRMNKPGLDHLIERLSTMRAEMATYFDKPKFLIAQNRWGLPKRDGTFEEVLPPGPSDLYANK